MVELSLKKAGNWNEANELLFELTKKTRKILDITTKDVAEELRDEMRKSILKGKKNWPKLSPLTTNRKGHSRPLIDTRRLLFSIKVKRVGRGEYFTGISSNEKTAFGINMALVAYVHEFGATVKPKKAKRLAVPISREAIKLLKAYKSIRRIPGIFRPKGTNVLAVKRGRSYRGSKLKILFVLLKRVKIPKRPFIAPAFIAVYKRVSDRYERALRKTLVK